MVNSRRYSVSHLHLALLYVGGDPFRILPRCLASVMESPLCYVEMYSLKTVVNFFREVTV